ncbi:AraC family transcriptional regulator [Amylibacter marinus]|uniref:AraC family transcriptional regulator n=1 Tax=Amylibacter marinus TaxID=1475483 RepID=A0ABQ5VY12_9RHOB|nr:GlxA family transcriptional regulator [Amylibacter marinus]GLQ36111.1 AraC family transcriptional regulator [Amylibacter marinus]
MQKSKKSAPTRTQKIDLLLFDHFSNHCLANIVEPLRAANTLSRENLYQWRFLTIGGHSVDSSSGLQIMPHLPLKQGQGDLLAIMPSYEFRALNSADMRAAIHSAARRYLVTAGFDTGSWLMAQASLLDGVPATIHWEELAAFAEAFPEVEVVRERFVIAGNRITCSGAMAAFDLTIQLIARDHGALLAFDVAQMFMHADQNTGIDRRISKHSGIVDRALHLMQQNIEKPLPISILAHRVGTSQKLLETRMRAAVNETPSAVYRRLRLNLAHKLIAETNKSVAEITVRCGYENATAMTRAFKTQFGYPPQNLRRRNKAY